ncbi:UBX domain-containing protein [Sarocladium implicatum]|nr:UBX domain-containing protein [Sarocladium implicatum]
MFYQGTLQEGISTAVGQQKLVLCFVTDEKEESQTWESDFLKDETLTELIDTQAVALRLLAGSEEAGYLAQIFPLPKTPTVVIIKNGELKEYVTAGTSREDFVKRVHGAFIKPPPSSSSPSAPAVSPPQPQTQPSTAAQTGTPSRPPPQERHSSNVDRILAERAARLKAQKEEAERKVKEERAKAKEKAKAEAEAGINSDAARTHKQAELVKKKRQQEQEERKRILQRIEDDREERRMRVAESKKARLEEQKTGDVAAALVKSPESKLPSTTRVGEMTAVQVRLFDGSTMRSRFKTASTVRELRKWVDENRGDGGEPYLFKQVLTPLPNRKIDETEESKDLGTLGLAPSSTLVLVPVQKSATAYAGQSGGLLGSIYGLFLGFFTFILSFIGIGGQAQARSSGQAPTASAPENAEQVRMREAQDSALRRRNQQLYNGNSTNFEPRPEEDED